VWGKKKGGQGKKRKSSRAGWLCEWTREKTWGNYMKDKGISQLVPFQRSVKAQKFKGTQLQKYRMRRHRGKEGKGVPRKVTPLKMQRKGGSREEGKRGEGRKGGSQRQRR